MNGKRDILSEGWPDEPGNADLEAFAQSVAGVLPELGEEALARVAGAMRERMERGRRMRRWRWIGAASAVAAALLVGLMVQPWRGRPETAQLVRDEYRVSPAGTGVGEVPVRALVPVGEYEGLLMR